jgi:hypothetical protein
MLRQPSTDYPGDVQAITKEQGLDMNKSRQEPVFLLEMSHQLRHLIMKRGLLLRSSRARTLSCMSKGGSKAWLEAKLIPGSGESTAENWDKAHWLADKFKRELHSDVYVEPACESGRFKEMTSPPSTPGFDSHDDYLPNGPDVRFGLGAGMHPSLGAGAHGAFGGDFGPGHNSGHAAPFGLGMGNLGMPGMPHIPDPMKDFLPPQVRQLMGVGLSSESDQKQQVDLTFPALRELPGWTHLPTSKQKMFEVEAAQLHHSGHFPRVIEGEPSVSSLHEDLAIASERALAAITMHPKISTTLKRFMLESFEAATVLPGLTGSA